jgi:hypothetical protein
VCGSPAAGEEPAAPQSDADVVERFNKEPHANLVLLCMHFRQSASPDSLAQLLHSVEGLDPSTVTTFLLSPSKDETCKAFFALCDLNGDFLPALRRCFCGRFVLPAEPKPAGRALRLFAERYVAANPASFSGPEDALTHAFALLLINGRSEPVAIVRAPGDRVTPSPDQIEALEREPLALSPRPLTWVGPCIPVMRGWLGRLGAGLGRGGNQYVVIAGHQLFWFADSSLSNQEHPLGKIDLTDVQVVRHPKSDTKFAIARRESFRMTTFANGRATVKDVPKVELMAPSRTVRDDWICALRRAVILAPFLAEDALAPTLDD